MCDKRERAINYLRILSWPSLNINVFWFLQKYLFKGKWSLAKSYFKQNYRHACHRWLAVFFTLPSCCLSSLVMTGRRYVKAASSNQSFTKLSTQTIPESFRDRQNPLAYISLVRPGSQCVLDFLLPPSPSPLPHKKAYPLPPPPRKMRQAVRAGDHLKQMSNNGKATSTFPPGRLLMTKATRVMSASLIWGKAYWRIKNLRKDYRVHRLTEKPIFSLK